MLISTCERKSRVFPMSSGGLTDARTFEECRKIVTTATSYVPKRVFDELYVVM